MKTGRRIAALVSLIAGLLAAACGWPAPTPLPANPLPTATTPPPTATPAPPAPTPPIFTRPSAGQVVFGRGYRLISGGAEVRHAAEAFQAGEPIAYAAQLAAAPGGATVERHITLLPPAGPATVAVQDTVEPPARGERRLGGWLPRLGAPEDGRVTVALTLRRGDTVLAEGTFTLLAAPPGAQPATIVPDPTGQCRMTLPAGFAEDAVGNGYFPAVDGEGFAGLDAPSSDEGRLPLDQVARPALAVVQRLVGDYRQTGVATTADTLRVEFSGTLGGRPGRGTVYFAWVGAVACQITYFVLDGAALPYEPTLAAMVASLHGAAP